MTAATVLLINGFSIKEEPRRMMNQAIIRFIAVSRTGQGCLNAMKPMTNAPTHTSNNNGNISRLSVKNKTRFNLDLDATSYSEIRLSRRFEINQAMKIPTAIIPNSINCW